MISDRCKRVYTPGRDLCVDESLLLFKGRLAFKQFIKTKRARFGIKFFELCSSNGILLDFLIYHGNMTNQLFALPEFLTSELIPITLLLPYLDKGFRLFVDNYYTTPRLASYLLERKTTLVGTVRSTRRQFPVELADADLEAGTSRFALSDSGVLAVKFRALQNKANNKPKVVYLLSTCHKNEIATAPKKDKDGNAILKPTCVLDYNKSMGGVDLIDQQTENLMLIRKSYKWYKKIFFRLLSLCLLSAHKIYKFQGGQHDFLKFVHDVITQQLTFSPRLNTQPSALDSISRLTGRNHFPSKRLYDGIGKRKASKAKKCRVCMARGRKTAKGAAVETTWVCLQCPSAPGLCLETDCFRDYHTKFDYSS